MTAVLEQYNDVLGRLDNAGEREPGSETSRILDGLGLPERLWHLPVARLSGGEKKLVAIAGFLSIEPDVLLLDEPDNHLDIVAKEWLETYLAAYKGVVGLISHDRYLIDRVANEIIELEDGTVQVYPGSYSTFRQVKRARLEREATLRELQVREFRKLKASAEQLTQWARQNPKFASRAENQRRKLAEERERLASTPAPVLDRRQIKVDFDAERGGTMVLEADALAQVFGSHVVFEPFDLTIRHGERVGLVGPNGAGKTTLFQIIRGDLAPASGSLRTGSSIQIGYFSQLHETLDNTKTPLELVRKTKALNEQQALSFLMGMLFDRDDAMRKVAELSGGELSRLQIALLIASGDNFLLLDEPTNNLDIASIEALEEALLAFPGAMLTISHDRFFLERICNRIIEIRDGLVRDYAGPYSFYQRNPGMGSLLTRAKPSEPEIRPGRRSRSRSKAISA
jgi:ATP-binding cassette subfamily F protein 3